MAEEHRRPHMIDRGISGSQAFPVVFCSDRNYLPHMATALFSLLQNDVLVGRVFLVSDEVTADDLTEVQSSLEERFGKRLELRTFTPERLDGLKTSGHISQATYARFILADVLPPDIDYVLYLDSDLIVRGELASLLPEEIWQEAPDREALSQPAVWAASEPHPNHMKEAGFSISRYFNAGVMLINLHRWRVEKIMAKLFEVEEEHRQHLKWWDQDVLNIVLADKSAELSPLLNGIIGRRRKDSRVIHFNSHRKPWILGSARSDWLLYREYRQKTPFVPIRRDFSPVATVKNLLSNKALRRLGKIRSALSPRTK